MSRIVPIIDSSTGALTDVAGASAENARYKRFARRLLSLDRNPRLDYGGNGGDELVVDKGGAQGKRITLAADTVRVTGDLLVRNKSIDEIVEGSEAFKGCVSKEDLADALEGISVDETDDFATVRGQFMLLLERLNELVSEPEDNNG